MATGETERERQREIERETETETERDREMLTGSPSIDAHLDGVSVVDDPPAGRWDIVDLEGTINWSQRGIVFSLRCDDVNRRLMQTFSRRCYMLPLRRT